MLKPRTIQHKLFISYSILILGIIILFIISFYALTAIPLENRTTESLQQLSAHISSQLDTELKNMNSLSMKILFSDPVKDLFFSDICNEDKTNLQGQREYNKLVYSITGPQFPVFQINMFQLNGNFAGIGNNSLFTIFSKETLDKIDWVREGINFDGNKLITAPHKDSWGLSDKMVVSMVRAFSNNWGEPVNSILEIQYDYGKLSDIIVSSLSSSLNRKDSSKNVFVFDSAGNSIYPVKSDFNPESMGSVYWKEFSGRKRSIPTFYVENPVSAQSEVVTYTVSEFSGWTVFVVEPKNQLLQPVTKFRNTIILAGIGLVFITLFISYTVSRGLTVPIKKIHKSIKNLSLQALPTKAPLQHDSGISELEELNLSFQDMCKNLTVSLEEVVSSRSHEIQARMLALQSQMNPHFLYNTLTVISIMAENGRNENIVKMCEDLSQMLRYISSDNSTPVTISQELEYTRSFVNLMKKRYGDLLEIYLNVPDSIMHVQVPSLIIEPLVENCTKYGVNVDPPWRIDVEGKQTENRWEITVTDNGPGFPEEKLTAIRNKLSEIHPYTDVPKLKLDGMGLLNIYIRLKLLYGEQAYFSAGNSPEGGAQVVVGGPIDI